MFAGSDMDLQLLEWLDIHVFPCESAFKRVDYAPEAYQKVITHFLSNQAIYLGACQKLVDIIQQLGQRDYVGEVNVNQNAPDYCIESTEVSLVDTCTFIEYVQAKKPDFITPVVTPRFAITCNIPLMKGLSQLSGEYKVPIQTHLCKNHDEIDFTCSLFKSKDYTSVYDDYQLLNENAYAAHCVHMTDN